MDSCTVFYEIEKAFNEVHRDYAMINIIVLLEKFSIQEYERGYKDAIQETSIVSWSKGYDEGYTQGRTDHANGDFQ